MMALTAIGIMVQIVNWLITAHPSCHPCLNYPAWWPVVLGIKYAAGLLGLASIFKFKKWGLAFILAFTLVNLVDTVAYKNDILTGIGIVISAGVGYSLIRSNFESYT